MIAAHELSVANWTGVLLLTSVGPSVSCQLVGTCKPSQTTVPVADVGFFACVSPVVSFEV